jgi:hypothetical protein
MSKGEPEKRGGKMVFRVFAFIEKSEKKHKSEKNA